MPEMSSSRLDALFNYAESLYRFALTLVRTNAEAAELVTETYLRARFLVGSNDQEIDRVWLFTQLWRIHAERAESQTEHNHSEEPPLLNLKENLQHQFFQQALPGLYLSLTTPDRSILTLCDGEGLSEEEASEILNLPKEDVSTRLHDIRARFVQALDNEAGSFRPILLGGLPDSPVQWLPDALRAAVHPLLPALPNAVKTAVKPAPRSSESAEAARTAREQKPKHRSLAQRFGRMTGIATLILFAGFLGYAITTYLPRPSRDTNLISLAVRDAGKVKVDFHAASPEQGERYLFDRLDWRITIPIIDDATFEGVGHSEIAGGELAPVLLFHDDTSNVPITVFAFNYAFLDRNEDRLQLEQTVLKQIQEDQHFDIFVLEEQQVLIWRFQDDIFVGVFKGDAEALRNRIQFPY